MCFIFNSLEIIKQLRTPMSDEPLRPTLYADICDERLIPLLKTCWSENPDHRPPFASIRRQLRQACPERSVFAVCLMSLTLLNIQFYLLWAVLSISQPCQHPGQHGEQTGEICQSSGRSCGRENQSTHSRKEQS